MRGQDAAMVCEAPDPGERGDCCGAGGARRPGQRVGLVLLALFGAFQATELALSDPYWIHLTRSSMLELAFRPDPGLARPVYQQLGDYVRGLIEAGRVVPGEKLPATRDLSSQLALSRNTVSHAYQRLIDEGVLTSHVGQGTFVAPRQASLRARHEQGGPNVAVPGFAWDGLIALRARGLVPPANMTLPAGVTPRFDFRGGRVDTTALPTTELRRAWSRTFADQLEDFANHLDPFRWGPLREEIALLLVTCRPKVLPLSRHWSSASFPA